EYFLVASDGTVSYDPALEGIVSGRGTGTLTIHGAAVTLDPRQLGIPQVFIDNIDYDATTSFTRPLLPGQHFLYTPYLSAYALNFSVGRDGTVSYDSTLEGILSGQGTRTLTINGASVTFDARPLGIAQFFLDNTGYDASAPITRRLLPGQHFLYTPYLS